MVWIGRDLEECHDCVDSGPLHMVLCIQLPLPHYLTIYYCVMDDTTLG